MIDPKIREYIQNQLKSGYPREDLKKFLIQNGYQPDYVDAAYNEIDNEASVPVASSPNMQNKGNNIKVRNPWVVILLTFVTFGIYGIIWLYSTTKELNESTSCVPPANNIFLFFVPIFNIVYVFIFYYKYCKGINELTGYNTTTLYVLFLFLGPVGMYIAQSQLNKAAS